MRISVIGTGYVGLVTGVCLAEKGHDVVCVDVDAEKVARVNRGEAPIFERDLPELLARNAGRRLRATTDLVAAVRDSEITLIAVGTPFDGIAIDLRFVEAVAREIGAALREKTPSTSSWSRAPWCRDTDSVVRPILEAASGKRAGEDFGVGMNPEFLTEGEAVGDFLAPDRIVIGGDDAPRSTCRRGSTRASPGGPAGALQQRHGRDDQVRLERAARDLDLVLERAREPRRGDRRDRHGGRQPRPRDQPLSRAAGGRRGAARRADPLLPARGLRLRRQLPAQGRRRARSRGAARGVPMDLLEAVLRINAAQPGRCCASSRSTSRTCAGSASRSWASRSATRTICASRRRSPVAALRARGAHVWPTTRSAEAAAARFGDDLPLHASLREALACADVAGRALEGVRGDPGPDRRDRSAAALRRRAAYAPLPALRGHRSVTPLGLDDLRTRIALPDPGAAITS